MKVSKAACVILALFAGACAAPRFSVPETPALEAAPTVAPTPPEAKPVLSEASLDAQEEDAAGAQGARVAPEGRIAILPIRRAGSGGTDTMVSGAMGLLGSLLGTGDEKSAAPSPGPALPPDSTMLVEGLVRAGLSRLDGGGDSVGRAIEDRLMRALLKDGVTKFLGPDELGAIAARKVAARDGQVTWQGSLDQLARVEPVTDAELLVVVRVDHGGPSAVEREKRWQIEPAALAAYRKAHQAYVDALTRRERDARAAAAAFGERCQEERRRYAADGGELGGQEATDGDRGVAECAATVARLEGAASEAATARDAAPSPDALVRDAEARREKTPVAAYDLATQIRLISAKDLRLLWLGELRVRKATQAEAVEHVTTRVAEEVRRLRTAGVAAVPAAPPGWKPR